MLNSKLRITELDFDTIKTNIKSFLSDQSEFSDYDFDGSGLSVLLDILAYNTHYNSYYLNMVANEMFLDSVSQRDSAVSIAKHLGYVTKSANSAEAVVTLSIGCTEGDHDDWPSTISVPKHTKFTTEIDSITYTFFTLSAYTATSYLDALDVRTFTLENIRIYEGKLGEIQYIVNQTGFEQKYIIPSSMVDTGSLVVRVKSSASSTVEDVYSLYDNVEDLTSTSKVYFIQEVANEQYEVYFGDDILGKKLTEGNVLTIEYQQTSGSTVNSANLFVLADTLSYSGQTDPPSTATTNTTAASGGVTDIESIESIKNNAPKTFQTQNRAVTKRDYKSIVISKYPNASSVITWGGEENDPPDYGSVYISIKPVTGLLLNSIQKQDLIDTVLNIYKVLAITPKVVDPDYTFLTVTSTVSYNSGTALQPENTIKDLVNATIIDFNKQYLGQFEKLYRHSQLVALIDDSDSSIVSNVTKIKAKKRIKPIISTTAGWTLKYNNSLVKSSFYSDNFYVEASSVAVKIIDDGSGNLTLVTASSGAVQNASFGTIDYVGGTVVIPSLNVNLLKTSDTIFLYFTVDVDETDIQPSFNQVLWVLDDDIVITMKEDLY